MKFRKIKWFAAAAALAVFTSATVTLAGGSTTGADLQVSGSASTGSPAIGSTYSYIFQVKNSGPQAATAATFSDPLHAAIGYVSATVNGASTVCGMSNSVVSCDLGTINSGAQVTVVINVIAPAASGIYSNTGAVSSSVADPQPNNNSFTVNVQVKAVGVVVPPAGVLTGPLYLRDSFGIDPPIDGFPFRYDAAGNLAAITQTSLNGLRAEWPNMGSEVWLTPNARQTPTWYLGPVASLDPATVEPIGSYDRPGENGVTVSNDNPTTETNNDALLAFAQPAGPVTASVSAISGWFTTAIGFTPSGALASNFENSGAAWLVLRMPRTTPGGQGSVATWELHTNGLKGPSVSGTFVLGGYNHIAVSYDPATGTVVGSVNGVATPALHYLVSGVKFVGFQGNGEVNDFLVQAGGIAAP